MGFGSVLENGCPSLSGTEGELVSVRVSVEPRLLEELLETLAQVPFPINPQLHHQPLSNHGSTIVEFPAYSGRLEDVRRTLARAGFDPQTVEVKNMLEEIRLHHAAAG